MGWTWANLRGLDRALTTTFVPSQEQVAAAPLWGLRRNALDLGAPRAISLIRRHPREGGPADPLLSAMPAYLSRAGFSLKRSASTSPRIGPHALACGHAWSWSCPNSIFGFRRLHRFLRRWVSLSRTLSPSSGRSFPCSGGEHGSGGGRAGPSSLTDRAPARARGNPLPHPTGLRGIASPEALDRTPQAGSPGPARVPGPIWSRTRDRGAGLSPHRGAWVP